MLGFLTFVAVWLGGALGGLALFNYFVTLGEKEERNLFFNDDVAAQEVFFILGPFSILLVVIIAFAFKAKEYLSKFKVGG